MAVSIRIDLDQRDVLTLVNYAVNAIQDYDIFAFNQITQSIRNQVFDRAVRAMCARAGPGWSDVYTDHLVRVLRSQVPFYGGGERGRVEIFFDLDDIGGYSELSRSAHHQALVDIGEFLIHPPQVQLPYTTESLVSSKERRQEFWENVIIERDGSFTFGPRQQFTMADLGYVATYDEIAMARVLAWGNKAPEWLWLENGFNESKPEIYPVDFLRGIESMSLCLASKIYGRSLIDLLNAFKGSRIIGKERYQAVGGAQAAYEAVAIGQTGRPFERATGKFVDYKKYMQDVDISECMGGL